MKEVGAFFKKSAAGIAMALICCVMLFVGIGFARITRELNIQADIEVMAQEGVCITDAKYSNGKNVSASENYVNEFYTTILNANVQLNETNLDCFAEFDVTIYNKYSVPYRYNSTRKLESVYTNNNIAYEVYDSTGSSLLEKGVVLNPGEYMNIKIRFLYSVLADMNSSGHNIANVCVNFDFNVYVKPVLADNMVPVEFNQSSYSWKRANEDSFNYADYDSGIWANAVTYDHSKIFSQNEYTTNGGTWFDGQQLYVNYRHENYDFGNTFTAGVRFKWTGFGNNSLSYLICNLESAGFGIFIVQDVNGGVGDTVGQIGLRYINDAGSQIDVLIDTEIAQARWYTLIVSYNGQTIRFYLDGILIGYENHSDEIKPSAAGISVGHNPTPTGSDGFNLNGNVSHVMVLDDVITADEALLIHSSTFTCSTKHLKEIIKLDTTSRDSNGKYFDGINDNAIHLGLSGYNFNQNNLAKMSIAIRFKILTLTSDAINYLACSLQNDGYGLGVIQKEGKCYLYFAFKNADPLGFIYVKGHETLDLQTWYTAVVTVDGYKIRMYLDGKEQSLTDDGNGIKQSAASTLKLVNSSVNLVLGGNPDANNKINMQWFNGWISECVVFKKALTVDEIKRDFANDFAFHYKKYSTSPTSTSVAQYVKYDYDNIVLQSDESYTEEGVVLNGVNDYVCVGLGNHNFNSSLTFAIRLKFTTIPSGARALVSNYEDAGFQLQINSNKNFEFYAYNRYLNPDTEKAVNKAEYATATNVSVEANKWYTLTCVVTVNGIRLYVNGVKQAETTSKFTLKNCMHPIFIGANPNNDGKYSGVADITVSDFAFINQEINENLVKQFFVGEINPSLARANCFLNFVGYQYRETNQTIPDKIINGFYTWIPRFKIKSTLESGEVDIEIVSKESEAHDAFTFNNVNVDGFWFSKFKNSLDNNGNIQTTSNVEAYASQDISEIFNKIKSIETGDSEFNTVNYAMLNIHMAKNSEWGAMVYLAQSKYGLFITGDYSDVIANASELTGYDYQFNTDQSTNQNVTGIYDIVGGTNEYVMANYNNTIGNSGFEFMPESIYYDVYSSIGSYYDSGLYHAMGEIDYYQPDENSVFVSDSKPWLVRSGLFDYRSATGEAGYCSRTSIFIMK